MTDGPSTPPSDIDSRVAASTSDAAWTGTDGPAPTPPSTTGRFYVPAGGTVAEGWYESVHKPTLRSRARNVVTRRVPLFAAALALLLGLGVGGGTAFALTDGHGGAHTAFDGRGAHDGSDGQRRTGR